MKSNVIPIALLVAAAASLTACEWIAERTAELVASANGSEVDMDMDQESGDATTESEDGNVAIDMEDDSGRFELTGEDGSVVRIATGKDAAIPDDFPSDVPLFPGFKPDMVQSLPGGTVAVAGSVPAAIPSVKSYYDQAALREGWTVTGSIGEEHVASLTYTKGERMLQVTATPDMAGTMISITTGKL